MHRPTAGAVASLAAKLKWLLQQVGWMVQRRSSDTCRCTHPSCMFAPRPLVSPALPHTLSLHRCHTKRPALVLHFCPADTARGHPTQLQGPAPDSLPGCLRWRHRDGHQQGALCGRRLPVPGVLGLRQGESPRRLLQQGGGGSYFTLPLQSSSSCSNTTAQLRAPAGRPWLAPACCRLRCVRSPCADSALFSSAAVQPGGGGSFHHGRHKLSGACWLAVADPDAGCLTIPFNRTQTYLVLIGHAADILFLSHPPTLHRPPPPPQR